MTRQDQRIFVHELTASIAASVVKAIEEEKIPAEWDGRELRELIYDLAKRSRGKTRGDGHSKRWRDYNNWYLITPSI